MDAVPRPRCRDTIDCLARGQQTSDPRSCESRPRWCGDRFHPPRNQRVHLAHRSIDGQRFVCRRFGLNAWRSIRPTYGLTLYSSALYTDLVGNSWGTTWNALIGKSYAIDTGEDKQTTFLGPEGSLTSTGGQISFSMSAVPEVSSSFALLGLFTSGLMLRRRAKSLR